MKILMLYLDFSKQNEIASYLSSLNCHGKLLFLIDWFFLGWFISLQFILKNNNNYYYFDSRPHQVEP